MSCVSASVGDTAILLDNSGKIVPTYCSLAFAIALERLFLMLGKERKTLGQRG